DRKASPVLPGWGKKRGARRGRVGGAPRRPAARCQVDTPAHKRLDRSRPGGDIDQFNIQTMALEYSRLFGNPRYGKSRGDRSVGDAELLQPLRSITRVRAKQA